MRRETIGRPMEVLLVEDSLTDARLTIAALQNGRIKHRLTLVRDGQEALDFLHRAGHFARAPRPDVILLDLLLPKKNGLDVLDDVRHDEELQTIPVVVLTSSTEEEDRLRSEALGVASYVTKPVDIDKFLHVLRELRDHWHSDLILPSLE